MKPLLTALLLLVFFNCIAQKNLDSLFFAKMQNRKISLPENSSSDSIFNLPFHDVQIIDARADTTSIGFSKYTGGTAKLFLAPGLANSFKNFIQTNYKLTTDSNSLFILIKEFRITDYAAIAGAESNNESRWNSGVIISTELFLNNNSGYHALYRIDSILIAKSNHETFEELIEKSFTTILSKSQNKFLSNMHIGKTAFSVEDIRKHAADFFAYPILKTEAPNKGVYKNFTEFENNSPSIKDFEIKKGKFTDEVLITENNQTYPLQNFWGYCDGKNSFIRSADNLFQLVRTGNTFNVKAIKSFSQKYNKNVGNEVMSSYILGVPASAFVKNNYKANPTAFQLNMQTGELY